MVPPVLAAVWFGPPWSDLLVLAALAILVWEWVRLTGGTLRQPAAVVCALGVLGATLLAACGLWTPALTLLPVAAVAAALLAAGPSRLWLAGGVLYLGLPGLAFTWLRHRPDDGLEVVVWLLLVVWAVDIFAYLVGSRVGGPKLWPAVSPKKTWSGLLGGVAAAALVALGGRLLATGWPLGLLALSGASLAVVAQLGDLFESAVKRRFGVKDASSIIPGHGGLLDRVDGLLAASLALAAALWLTGP